MQMKIITGESIRIEQTMKCHWMDWCVLCVSAWKQCVCYKIVNIYINMLLRWKNCNGLDGKRENAKYVAPFGGMWFIIWFRFVCFCCCCCCICCWFFLLDLRVNFPYYNLLNQREFWGKIHQISELSSHHHHHHRIILGEYFIRYINIHDQHEPNKENRKQYLRICGFLIFSFEWKANIWPPKMPVFSFASTMQKKKLILW